MSADNPSYELTIVEKLQQLSDIEIPWAEEYWKVKNKKRLLERLDQIEKTLKEIREDVETDPEFHR